MQGIMNASYGSSGGGGGNGFPNDFSHLFRFTSLSPKTQQHLFHVYRLLAAGMFISALGTLSHLQHSFLQGGLLSSISSVALVSYLSSPMSLQHGRNARLAMFSGFTFLQGLSMGGLVEYANIFDSSILPTAFLATMAVFISFSLSALSSPRRSFFFLSSILSSALLVILLLSVMNIFFASPWLFSLELYMGLLMFCGYILYDTQVIIERSELRRSDDISDASTLFIDLVAVFARLVVILMRNREQDNRRRRNKD